MVSCQSHICLLFPIRSVPPISPRSSQTQPHSPDQRVYLGRIHIVEFLHGILDLALVRPDVHNKYQCVVFLNFLHRRFSVQRPACHVSLLTPINCLTHETTVRNWSIRGAWGIDLRGYLGSRASFSVFGRWNDTENRSFRTLCECVPCRAAFLAALAFESFPDTAHSFISISSQNNTTNAPLAAALPLVVFVVAMMGL